MRLATMLAFLCTVARVSAHIVPVPDSMCAFDPITIETPATGVVGTAAPASPADSFRIQYRVAESTAMFDLSSVPPRSFTAAGVSGTIALPSFFVANLRNDGNLTVMPSFGVTLGAGTVTVPISITTGLVVAGGAVLEGTPLGADGRFTLIGVVEPSPLGPPLDQGPLLLRLGGQAVPRPDTDQFRLATRTTPLSASLTAKRLKLRAIFAPGSMDAPDFPGRPALLRFSSGGAAVATVDLPAGLPARGRKLFVGRSADGATAIGVRALRRSGTLTYLLALKVASPTLPAAASSPVQVGFTYDLGGLLSHVTLGMRVKRGGALLRYP